MAVHHRYDLGYGLIGLFVVFLGVLLVLPYVKMIFPTVSGFENMTCQEGREPCPEGYFCEQKTCVPILPKYDINAVKPNSQYY
jgi:hypothetical protein